MATRYYFEGSFATATGLTLAAPPITPAFDASWERTTGAVRRWLSTAKEGTAFATLSNTEAVATNPYDVAIAQFISAPLAAQTISGAVKGQLLAWESNLDADYRAQLVIWVVQSDGTTSRGTLLASDGAALSSEWATSQTNRKFPLAASSPATLSSLAVSAGDRLVVEVGFRSHNSHTTSRTGSIRTGTDAGSDLAENETDTTDANPWLEFDSTITFGAYDGRVSQTYLEAVVKDAGTPELRVSQTYLEAVVKDPTPELRVSQVYVEAVCDRDYAGWDVLHRRRSGIHAECVTVDLR